MRSPRAMWVLHPIGQLLISEKPVSPFGGGRGGHPESTPCPRQRGITATIPRQFRKVPMELPVFRLQILVGSIILDELRFFTIPVKSSSGFIGHISQMSHAGNSRSDFNTGIGSLHFVPDTSDKVFHMVVKPIAESFLQRHTFNFWLIVFFFRDYLPTIAIHYKSAIVAYKSYPMRAAIITTVNSDTMIPQESEVIKLIQGLEGVGSFTGIFRIGEFPPMAITDFGWVTFMPYKA